MARSDCEDCHGTGEIECETVKILKTRHYDKESGIMVVQFEGCGDWHMAQCPCVGEEDHD